MLFYIALVCIVTLLLLVLTVPQLKGWRSMIFHTGVVLLGGAVPMLSQQFDFLKTVDWTELVTNKQQLAVVTMTIGLLGVTFRYLTTSAVGSKQ